MRPSTQTGVALITAILVVALAAILAASLLDHLNFDIRRTQNILIQDQASLYNEKYLAASRGMLYEDRVNTENDTLIEADEYKKLMGILPEEGSVVSSNIIDLQGKFNLNNLASTPGETLNRYRTEYIALLGQFDIDPVLLDTLADRLIDWLDGNDEPVSANGAEFDTYLGLTPPYRPGNQLMVSISELRQVHGYTRDIFRELKDHICALPISNSPINVNTASEEVLNSTSALNGRVADILSTRKTSPYETIASLTASTPAPNNATPTGISVSSEYFLVRNKIQSGKSLVIFYNMIHRNAQGQTRLLRQSRGTL